MTPELERAILEKVEAFPRTKGSIIYDQLAEEDKLFPANISRSTFYRYLANQPTLKGLGDKTVEKQNVLLANSLTNMTS